MQNKTLSFFGTLCISLTFCTSVALAQDAIESNQRTITPEEQQMLNAELSNASSGTKAPVDFPGRTDLGSLELAPLPGLNESLITGPAAMAPSVSTQDLPSEQLLGRITTEVFQEMADLERGNVFLKLQMEKEQLRNDLERLKAAYRQTRLEEIAKREDVVRTRITWWQEQESIRLDLERKKAETEAVEREIAEAEELRSKLRAEALERMENETEEEPERVVVEIEVEEPDMPAEIVATDKTLSQLYTLVDIKGTKKNLIARLRNMNTNTLVSARVGTTLPSGHIIKDVRRDRIVAIQGDRKDVLVLSSPISPIGQ